MSSLPRVFSFRQFSIDDVNFIFTIHEVLNKLSFGGADELLDGQICYSQNTVSSHTPTSELYRITCSSKYRKPLITKELQVNRIVVAQVPRCIIITNQTLGARLELVFLSRGHSASSPVPSCSSCVFFFASEKFFILESPWTSTLLRSHHCHTPMFL